MRCPRLHILVKGWIERFCQSQLLTSLFSHNHVLGTLPAVYLYSFPSGFDYVKDCFDLYDSTFFFPDDFFRKRWETSRSETNEIVSKQIAYHILEVYSMWYFLRGLWSFYRRKRRQNITEKTNEILITKLSSRQRQRERERDRVSERGERELSLIHIWLNDVTKKERYRLRCVHDTLDTLSGTQLFSTLDLKSGYLSLIHI